MIELTNATKKYGRTMAVDHISLSITKHGIYCLLGRNGAGKTTLMKLIAGHIGTTDGMIKVDGIAVSTNRMPESVNFIESGAVQFNMRVSELIKTAAELQDGFDIEFAQKMIKRFDLDTGKKFKQLSFGMKTMLTTIITLANQSKIILLDEPTLGFDAIMRDQFNNLLLESYNEHPRIIIVSTHLIDEIAKVTGRLLIIDTGKILVETGIDDIDENAYILSGLDSVVLPLAEKLNCIGKTTAGSAMAAYIYDKRIAPPEGVVITRMSLQDFFIHIVGGKSDE
ncbi:MAG: ABC transporter ATP-binding protein [Oscillospiraceae bacterium]|jgi:ABC-2 type transport system ATP-binding protein|nr:ABC transporter ATP-binding protein [Oscillospiraceae bacterium]